MPTRIEMIVITIINSISVNPARRGESALWLARGLSRKKSRHSITSVCQPTSLILRPIQGRA